MSDECIFCRIVDGDIPARVVYEDDDVLAFLDANPLAPGHTLVIPKEHYEDLEATPAEDGEMTFAAVHYLTPIVKEAVDAAGSNIGVNDGEVAGQEVDHLHVHIIPRFEGDGGGPIHNVAGERPELSDDKLDDIANTIETEANE